MDDQRHSGGLGRSTDERLRSRFQHDQSRGQGGLFVGALLDDRARFVDGGRQTPALALHAEANQPRILDTLDPFDEAGVAQEQPAAARLGSVFAVDDQRPLRSVLLSPGGADLDPVPGGAAHLPCGHAAGSQPMIRQRGNRQPDRIAAPLVAWAEIFRSFADAGLRHAYRLCGRQPTAKLTGEVEAVCLGAVETFSIPRSIPPMPMLKTRRSPPAREQCRDLLSLGGRDGLQHAVVHRQSAGAIGHQIQCAVVEPRGVDSRISLSSRA